MSCKVLSCNKNINISLLNNLQIIPNKLILCLLINDKKIYYDVENNELLKFHVLLSTINNNCYSSLFNNKSLYFIDDNNDYNMILNEENLFALIKYIFADEYTKKDFGSKLYVEDYLSFLDESTNKLLNNNNDSFDIISDLNIKLSEEQNKIYKKVKKI